MPAESKPPQIQQNPQDAKDFDIPQFNDNCTMKRILSDPSEIIASLAVKVEKKLVSKDSALLKKAPCMPIAIDNFIHEEYEKLDTERGEKMLSFFQKSRAVYEFAHAQSPFNKPPNRSG